ncbi:hypothetical protein ACH47Z_36195 [Streptomyces sp. NPDC020192]|uniref:hypothetical protein n=1 Tax=Streptomyces sp. NPDC020192 TaxID=3365066 RepID=UPI00379DE6FA
MSSSIKNIVMGVFKSRIMLMNAGSFSIPSSMVMKTTRCDVDTCANTGTSPVAESAMGLSAGGFGAAGIGVSPHLCQAVALGAVLEAPLGEGSRRVPVGGAIPSWPAQPPTARTAMTAMAAVSGPQKLPGRRCRFTALFSELPCHGSLC